MKTFTKILALVIALMMVVSVFAACGKKDKKPTNDNPPTGDTTPGEDDKTPGEDDKTPGEGEDDPQDPQPPVDEDTATVYAPTFAGCIMGLDYAWGNDEMTLDFTDSKIVRVKVADLDEATAALLTDPTGEKFSNRVIQFKGADTFTLPGFDKETVAKLFTAGYTATINIEYYAKAGTMSVVAINGDTTREIVAADKFEEGVNTINFDYTVAEGDTAIAFVTTGEAEFYFGRLTLVLYAGGPSYNQLAAGHTFNWALLPPGDTSYGVPVQVKDIADETAKAAILASGKTEDDYVITKPAAGDWNALNVVEEHYEEGRLYTIEVTYYSAAAGGAGWFLVLDGTPSNNGVKNGMFNTKAAVATSECVWEVTDIDRQAIWYDAPSDLIIIDVKISLDTTDPHYVRKDMYTPTLEDLADTYTFDFSEGNIPLDTGRFWLDVEILSEELQAVLTEANGFGPSVMHIKSKAPSFQKSMSATFTLDHEYTFTIRAYCAGGNVGDFHLLPMNASGNQIKNGYGTVPSSVTPVEGLTDVYDITWTNLSDYQLDHFKFYGTPATDLYVGSLTVTKGKAVEPEPLPDEYTKVLEGDDIVASYEAKGAPATYGTWGQAGVIMDTPDEVKAAMGDKIGAKTIKVDGTTKAASFLADREFCEFAAMDGKTKMIITIDFYAESVRNGTVIFTFNGENNIFPSYGVIVEGVNQIVLEYTASAATWNVGFHQGDVTGYIGDITIEYVHI